MKDKVEADHVREDVLIIVHRGEKFLLAERRRCRSQNGYWSIPGGEIEPGETAVEAAMRELREEAGLDLPASRFDYWGSWEGDTPQDPRDYWLHCTAVCLRDDEEPRNTEPELHGPWTWLTLGQIGGLPVTSSILSLIMRARVWDNQ